MSAIQKGDESDDQRVDERACEVGRLVDSSQADDRRMIQLVRERRLLYARNNMPVASYYAQVRKLWAEVALHMGWTVADVRRKWSHVRNSYSRHLRNELHGARTGRGRAVSRWYLANELEFLREHMATDTTRTSHERRLSHAHTLRLPAALRDLERNESKFMACRSQWFDVGTPPALAEPKQEPLHSHDDDSCGSQAFDSDENSSYFQFFRGIYNDYQELSGQQQRLFKRQCLNFLHELLDEAEGAAEEGAVDLSHDQNNLCVVENIESISILPNV